MTNEEAIEVINAELRAVDSPPWSSFETWYDQDEGQFSTKFEVTGESNPNFMCLKLHTANKSLLSFMAKQQVEHTVNMLKGEQ